MRVMRDPARLFFLNFPVRDEVTRGNVRFARDCSCEFISRASKRRQTPLRILDPSDLSPSSGERSCLSNVRATSEIRADPVKKNITFTRIIPAGFRGITCCSICRCSQQRGFDRRAARKPPAVRDVFAMFDISRYDPPIASGDR
jgi:hypothetical protein